MRASVIHYVPQDPLAALTPTARVRALLAEALRAAGDTTATARGLLERVRLPFDQGFLRRRPHQLSGGQRQRLLLALALVGPPRVIVLDEPTAGQDAATRDALLEEVARLRRDAGVTLVTISHDDAVADRLGDTVLRMENGRLAGRSV